MKYLAFIILGFVFIFEGCCGYDEGGYSYQKISTYARKVKLTDTSDRIIKISYKNSNKIFYPNDTIAELIISENTENTLFIETKNNIDTIVLRVEINYEYSNGECNSNELSKVTTCIPKIVKHTFQNASISVHREYDQNNSYVTNDFHNLFLTP